MASLFQSLYFVFSTRPVGFDVTPYYVRDTSVRDSSGAHMHQDLGDVKRTNSMDMEETESQLEVGLQAELGVKAAMFLVYPSPDEKSRLGWHPTLFT